MRLSIWVAALFLVGTAAHAGEPSPKDLQTARDLFAKATLDEERGRFDEALPKLEQAMQVKTTPGLKFHVGYAKERLGRYKEALADYEEAERLAREEKKDEVLAALKERLPALRERLPSVEISIGLLGFEVEIDRAARFTYQEPIRLDPGPHRVVIEKSGYQPLMKEFILHERDRVHLEVVLEPAKASGPHGSSAGAAAPEAASKRTADRTPAIVLAVATGVLIGTGIPFYVLAENAQSSGEACQRNGGDCETFRNRVRTYDWTAAGLFVAGVGTGVASIVLFAQSSTPTKSARITWTGSGIQLTGSFE